VRDGAIAALGLVLRRCGRDRRAHHGRHFFWGKKNSDSWGMLARVGAAAAGTSRRATRVVGGGGRPRLRWAVGGGGVCGPGKPSGPGIGREVGW
jgi:hypothetical protein